MNIVGENVRTIREQNGWTQEQLTAKCNLLEWNISRGTLAKIESKVRRVTDIEVKLLAEALETNIGSLFLSAEN
ncbi:helix-turn-helix domain-containing protein [Shewanella frigidimarina]|uniref:helix-turn-helix domain-containing protein n=1 Tax=Shewanella frigidimarina TaxID=56812 RepID=UPI003D7A0331